MKPLQYLPRPGFNIGGRTVGGGVPPLLDQRGAVQPPPICQLGSDRPQGVPVAPPRIKNYPLCCFCFAAYFLLYFCQFFFLKNAQNDIFGHLRVKSFGPLQNAGPKIGHRATVKMGGVPPPPPPQRVGWIQPPPLHLPLH